MKARYFRKLRKKFKNSKWAAKKYRELLEKSRYWNNFYKFECSDFFRGYDLAEHNREVARVGSNKNDCRLRYMKKYLK